MTETSPADVPFDRGHVVWHDGFFRGSRRPWFVLSDDRHPFYGEEYVVMGITTTARASAVELGEMDWAVGGLPRTSYVSPWFLTTLKHAEIDCGVGRVAAATVETVVDEVVGYIG